MNTQHTTQFAKLSKTEANNQTKQVKETPVIVMHEEKSFTNADLWNILRLKRSIVQRRMYA